MADYKYVSYENLSRYTTNIKNYIDTEDAKAYKTIIEDTTAKKLYFYKKANAVKGTDTPDVVVNIDFIPLIQSAAGDKIAVTASNGTVVEGDLLASQIASITYVDEAISAAASDIASDIAELSSAIASVASDLASLEEYVGEIPSTASASTVTGYVDEAIDSAIDALDSNITIASKTGNVLKIYTGITESDGVISITDTTSGYEELASVAITGAAADVALSASYTTIDESATASNVESAIGLIASDIAALASATEGGVASKTIYIDDVLGSEADTFSKRYLVYQGADASDYTKDVLVGQIDIPKDMVVESGSVTTITYDAVEGKLYDGLTDVTSIIVGPSGTASASDAGKYIKLIIANATSSVIYIKATDLVDIYTVELNATQVQLAIDANNVISATIVAGSITATELASSAVTTVKIADANVTYAKLASDVTSYLELASTALQSSDFEAITDAEIDSLFSSF